MPWFGDARCLRSLPPKLCQPAANAFCSLLFALPLVLLPKHLETPHGIDPTGSEFGGAPKTFLRFAQTPDVSVYATEAVQCVCVVRCASQHVIYSAIALS